MSVYEILLLILAGQKSIFNSAEVTEMNKLTVKITTQQILARNYSIISEISNGQTVLFRECL